jgi:FkbM family methyltransferase
MIKFLRKILGEDGFNALRAFKLKHFPTKTEREAIIRRKKLYSSLINPGELCFDVGANIGNRIVPLLQVGAKVVAVEPQESCHALLKQRFGNRIELVTKGLSDKEEIKKFYISNASVLSSFSEEWIDAGKKDRFKEYEWNKVVMTEMTTLDLLIAQYGVPVFIKIDVEGFELQVLKGLSVPIKTISFEYAAPEQSQRAIDCINRIEQINPAIECNYAVGESMELALKEWLPANKMREHILSQEFGNTFFGDIYVRSNPRS